jgi:hypothetical protein
MVSVTPSPGHGRAGGAPGDLLRLMAAVFSVGAGAIHLLEAPDHDRQAAVYGRFFLVVGTAQLAGGLLLGLRRWPRAAYRLAATGQLLVAGVWAATRTVGIPIGPDAGTRPAVAPADLAATLLETVAALVLLAVALGDGVGWPARLDHLRVGGRGLTVWLAVLGAGTAGMVVGTVGPQRPLCQQHTSRAECGPLAAVEGHSLLPRTTPPVTVQLGRPAQVLVGYLINCATEPVTVERIDVLSTTGPAARIASFWVAPTVDGAAAVLVSDRRSGTLASRVGWRPAEGVVVSPSSTRAALAVYADLQARQPGHVAVSALRVTVRDDRGPRIQPFATVVQAEVAGPGH